MLPRSRSEPEAITRRISLFIAISTPLLACSLVDRLVAPPTSAVFHTAEPTPTPAIAAEAAESTPAIDSVFDMDRIRGQVSSVRGLYPSGPLDQELLSPASIRQRVVDDFLGDYTRQEAEDDARTLALFGLLAPGFHLWDFYADLYEEQIAGYYDPDIQEMYVVGSSWGGYERLTYAHEYVHALQDQNYDLQDGLGYSDERCLEDPERCAAISALIEGDATLVEEQWWRAYATEQDLLDLSAHITEYDPKVFDSAPAFLQRDFLFPYEEGLSFVQALFRKGGWAAVDAAYLDPPTTTEMILHPDRYGKDEPIPVSLPDLKETLGEGWRELDAAVLGEWFTRLVLEEELPEREAEQAAAGWGGDAYRVWTRDANKEGALVLLTVWDSSRDAFEFTEAFDDYAASRFGERKTEQTDRQWSWRGGAVRLERSYDQTLWILAPDSETAVDLRNGIEFPLLGPG